MSPYPTKPIKSEKVCEFYAHGKGECYRGDKCSFKHYEGFVPQAESFRAYLDGRVSFFVPSSVNQKLFSLVGEEGSRSYLEILLSYLKDRIAASDLYMRLKDYNLLHLVEEVAASLKFKYPKRYSNLMEVIIREKASFVSEPAKSISANKVMEHHEVGFQKKKPS